MFSHLFPKMITGLLNHSTESAWFHTAPAPLASSSWKNDPFHG